MQYLKPSTLRPGGDCKMAHNRPQALVKPNVRFGSKADMCSANQHVRFTLKSGHAAKARLLLGCAILSTVAVRP